MAGDWIKMRLDLQSHPKVVRILSALRPQDGHTVTDKFRVIGGLHAVWSVFDIHSVDGRLHGYTPELMDHIIGWPGFAEAMISVGWLGRESDQVLVMPEFSEHNGKSAKRRAEDQKRKRDTRRASDSCPRDVRNMSEEERTREEKNIPNRADSPPTLDAALFAEARKVFGDSIGGSINKAIKTKGKPWVYGVIEECRGKDTEAAKAYLHAALNGRAKERKAVY